MEFLPIALYWGIALTGLVSRRPILLWLFFAALPFGSMVVIPANMTAGLSLVPQTMTAMLIVLRELVLRRGGTQFLLTLSRHGSGQALVLFWVTGVVVTLFAPRLFAGQIDVVPMAVTGFMQTAPLSVTKQNISQLAYITVSVFAIFAFARSFRNEANLWVLIRGVMLAGVITIVTGLLDFAATYVPLAPLLDMFRTAQYAILDSVTLADGAKRVTGLMPEASSFGGLSLTLLSLLWFLRRAMTSARMVRRANVILAGLALMLALSTSSAGYVGIAVLLAMIGLEWAARAGRFQSARLTRRGIRREIIMALAALGALAGVLMTTPQLLDPVIARLNEMVFTKTDSLSYLERSMWTRTSFEAGLSSYMIGVGLGSTRASNFAAALFGSVGLVGFVLYFGFVLRRLTRPVTAADPVAQAVALALKWSFAPPFVVALLVGTTPDFGTVEALRWGVLLALVLMVPSQAAAPHRPMPSRIGPQAGGATGTKALPRT
ncbi:hypothetical protein SAMN04488003_11940 [Loktanella fryxellensis]|uniref:O-antigen ligase like membrane protein n=1 Tax=Loktanella fryxellensis TaxID=245187 RepID=A0A1H8H600_9RHOB|nr:hypothetical protein [Loktanella fryxellensis]SEN51450.1 hypothetical protein SAMN04488003_11940 [Loktanella fryxellensis]